MAGRAVHGDDFRQVKNHPSLFFFDDRVHFSLKHTTLLPTMNAALEGEHGYARLKLMFGESQGHYADRSRHFAKTQYRQFQILDAQTEPAES